ncbi:MAG TPA: vitamin K epoxide reductase family protein [Candidatus Nanoarchaeia archaeon]|nr:vitamin K epoxide reductase family protein [Candidatus Nanoarchaeia archaeon]
MKSQKIFAVFFLSIALIGFADATYLTIQDSLNIVPPCFVSSGCETVLTSSWSKIGGVSVALLGTLYYLAIVVLSTFFLLTKKEKILRITSWGTFLGLFATLWFVSLQLFIIKNICFYCMISAATSIALFILGTIYIFTKPKAETTTPVV